ncbi:MAG: alpha/beta fold hydrolase [Gemmatimonadales bacterium]
MVIRIAMSGLLFLSGPLLSPQTARAQGATANVNGISLRYEVEGSGEPLVLIHGWALSRTEWDGQVELLSPHYRVIRYDRRGFGESSGKPDVTADPADLKALLETLGYPQAHILGHSAGGAVALTFAVRYPGMVDGLILFGAGPPDGFGLAWDGADAFPFEEWAEIARTRGIDSLRVAMSPLADMMFPGQPEGARRARREMAAYKGLDLIDPAPPSNIVLPARIDELRKVRAPTLVIVGEHEMPYMQIVADALTYGITGARKAVIPGGGHGVNWVEPERFVAEILRFLRAAEL